MSKHLRMLQGNDFGVACCPEPRSLAVARTTLHPTRPGLSMTNPLNKGVVSWSTGCSQMWLMEHVSKLVPSDSQILHWIQIDLPISIWIHSKTIYSVPRSSTCFTSSIFQYNTQTFHKIRLFIYKKTSHPSTGYFYIWATFKTLMTFSILLIWLIGILTMYKL